MTMKPHKLFFLIDGGVEQRERIEYIGIVRWNVEYIYIKELMHSDSSD